MRPKRALKAAGLLLLLLVSVLLIRTLRFASRQLPVEPVPPIALDEPALVTRFAQALTFRTVSFADPAQIDDKPFDELHRFLAQSFPRVHAELTRERLGKAALLFTWKGSDPSLPPIALMAHQDVVPVEDDQAWTVPPFEGRTSDGYVWGRGALDDKACLMAIFEATELALAQKLQLRRTIYLAFGADEEIGGRDGALRIAGELKTRGVHLAWVLDEGMAVLDGLVPGIADPVASIGIAEKGYATIELKVRAEGGHSSMPPRHTAVGQLARAIARIEEHPFPARFDGATRSMFRYLGPEMPFGQRLVFANTWLFGPLLERQLAKTPPTDALLRTTTAATVIAGGLKDNVLPREAHALVNFRILPGDTSLGVLDHVRAAIADPQVDLSLAGDLRSEPSPVSTLDGAGFQLLHKTVRQVFPTAVVAPGLVLGATDSRHLQPLADGVYRFAPFTMKRDDPRRIHGVDERLAPSNYAQGVRFYFQLLRNAAE